MKKLNNKGFTLIELLAVIVILAVVMGIAANSVLSAMNNSRKSSLLDSAKSAAASFRTAYAEAALDNNTTSILGVAYSSGGGEVSGKLTADTATALNISSSNYNLGKSFVKSTNNGSNFVVCLVADKKGSYFVTTAVKKENFPTLPTGVESWDSTNGEMFACSDDSKSW